MNRNVVARELLKVAKLLESADFIYELRERTWDDVENDTRILDLKVVKKGTMKEISDYAKSKGYKWVIDRKAMFHGYYTSKDKETDLLIT